MGQPSPVAPERASDAAHETVIVLDSTFTQDVIDYITDEDDDFVDLMRENVAYGDDTIADALKEKLAEDWTGYGAPSVADDLLKEALGRFVDWSTVGVDICQHWAEKLGRESWGEVEDEDFDDDEEEEEE